MLQSLDIVDIFIDMTEKEENLSDQDILRYVDSLEIEKINDFHDDYEILDLKHYLTIQLKWMETAKWFAGIHLGKNPSDLEFVDDWEVSHNPARFRVFYIIKYNDKILKLNKKLDI